MKIDMKRLAKLSKLKFSPEEEAKFEKEMEWWKSSPISTRRAL